MLAAQVNVLSPNGPSKQFLPDSAFGAGFGLVAESTFRRALEGDPGVASGILQTFTCRTPALEAG